MRMIAIQAKPERKRQAKSARRAEERRRRAGMLRAPGPIHPIPRVRKAACKTQDKKRLIAG